jgi:hypothetical protein
MRDIISSSRELNWEWAMPAMPTPTLIPCPTRLKMKIHMLPTNDPENGKLVLQLEY